jgi:hypothetical protein
MPGDGLWFDETGDEIGDNEFPEEDDYDQEGSETVPCPQCGTEVYEDAVQCPVCGTYLTQGGRAWTGRPAWWIVLGLLGILAVILALAGYSAW